MKSLRYYRNLIKRRGGIWASIKLQYRFWKIGRDKYVRMARKAKR